MPRSLAARDEAPVAAELTPRMSQVQTVEATTDPRLIDAVTQMDLEGIVAKRRADPTRRQRSG